MERQLNDYLVLMNNKEFITELAQRTSQTQQATQNMVIAVMEQLLAEVEESESFQIPQFGTFEVKKRLERILVNPNTGNKMLVPPKLVLGFKPVATFKERLQKGGNADEQAE